MTCSPNWLLLIYLQLVSTQLKNSCDISTSVLLLHAINMGNFNLRIQSQIHTLSFNGLRCFPPFSLSQLSVQFSSVAQSCPTLCDPMNHHTRPPFPSPTPGVHSNSCPSSRWCHPAISSSIVPFSSCSQSLPASGSFPMSQLFAWGGQSTGVSASASILPKNTQDWSPLGWTGWISLQSRALSRVFSNTTVQKHQFFSAQLSLYSNSHIHSWLLEKP